ncbi:MAG: nucleoside-diphosphate kinase [Candidatus Diapherotrites archaeon]|nr:nucleoside-diphosphate kinase [Candidatus Diapherotrites archaeon]
MPTVFLPKEMDRREMYLELLRMAKELREKYDIRFSRNAEDEVEALYGIMKALYELTRAEMEAQKPAKKKRSKRKKKKPGVERTLLFVKPDGVRRGLIGEVISRIEKAGLKIIGLKMVWLDEEWAKKHYPDEMAVKIGEKAKKAFLERGQEFPWKEEEYGKAILEALRRYVTSAPIVAMVIEGPRAIGKVRAIVGDTAPSRAAPGTIRGDFACDDYELANLQTRSIYNVVHASDSEGAEREIKELFSEDELYPEYTTLYEEMLGEF